MHQRSQSLVIIVVMDIESYGYIVSKQGADQRKDPVVEPEIDLDEERDPEVEEIAFENDQEVEGSGNIEVPGPEILVDEKVDEQEVELVENPSELGRPSKLDSETVDLLVTGLKGGLSQKKSAIYAGIGETTFYRWQRAYKKIDEECGGNPKAIKNADDLDLWEFWQSIKKAKIEGELGHLAVINKAASNGVWQASAWYLERSNPEEWSKRERNVLDDGGDDEDTIKVYIRYSS